MRRAASLAVIGFLFAAAGKPQAFEVASIKPSGPGSSDPGIYRYGRATLLDFLCTAYNVDPFQILSAAPLNQERFDLTAKIPEGATKEQFRMMLRSLLAERFALKARVQSREFAAYELVIAKTGPKLDKPLASGENLPDIPANRPSLMARNSFSGGFTLVRLTSRQEPISALARMLRSADDLPIVDKTGLTGKYDFNLEYTVEAPGATVDGPPVAPSLFSALQQQLGLQLVRAKAPFDVVIVDAVSKLPTEN